MNYECLHEYSRNTHSHLAGQKQVLAEATITMVLTVLLSSFRFLVYCDYVGFTWFFTVNTEWLLLSGSASFPFTSYNLIYTSFCIFYLETGLTKLLRLALNSLCGPKQAFNLLSSCLNLSNTWDWITGPALDYTFSTLWDAWEYKTF